MNKKSLRIGELLVQLGRITPMQVADALRYQQEHGGYLGGALMQLGALTRDELRWSLAEQHDLPYVRLRPESIDSGLAARVPAAWAREHHVLPVLLIDGEVTVVLSDIADLDKLEEVRLLTGARAVAPALSSPEDIEALIDTVYGPYRAPVTSLSRFLDEVRVHGAEAIGISVRAGDASGWYRVVETVHRSILPDWQTVLADALSPFHPLAAAPDGGHRSWPALLRLGADSWCVECEALGQGDALEWSARLIRRVPRGLQTAVVDPDLDAAIRTRLARGSLLIKVLSSGTQETEDWTAGIPNLPMLVLGRGARAFHLSDRGIALVSASLHVPLRGTLLETLGRLTPFAPQAVTLNVQNVDAGDEPGLRNAAPLTVLFTRDPAPAGIHTDLTIALRVDARGFVWALEGREDGEN